MCFGYYFLVVFLLLYLMNSGSIFVTLGYSTTLFDRSIFYYFWLKTWAPNLLKTPVGVDRGLLVKWTKLDLMATVEEF